MCVRERDLPEPSRQGPHQVRPCRLAAARIDQLLTTLATRRQHPYLLPTLLSITCIGLSAFILDKHQISKGYGFVTFESEDDVRNVTKMGTFFTQLKPKLGAYC